MLNENAQAWVDALRSGDYEQGTSFLHTVEADYSLFCCLGVACDLFATAYPEAGAWVKMSSTTRTDALFDAAKKFVTISDVALKNLPLEVCDWLGLAPITHPDLSTWGHNKFVEFNNGSDSLIRLNDGELYTFDQIADVIESEPSGLFREVP